MRQGVNKEYLKGSRRYYCYRSIPFDKFLRSRLGRVWDDVYSEMSAEFDKRSLSGRNFFRDIAWHVQTNCWIGAETGNVYDSKGSRLYDEFYVHPHTGVLCYAEKFVRPEEVRPKTYISIEKYRGYEKIEGIWYYVEFVDNPHYNRNWSWIVQNYEREQVKLGIIKAYKNLYSHPYNLTFKRQLSKKELKKLGVRNG